MTLPSSNTPVSQSVAASPRRTSYVAAAVAMAMGAACALVVMQQSATRLGGVALNTSTNPAIQAGPITLLFGGFTELATIYRNEE